MSSYISEIIQSGPFQGNKAQQTFQFDRCPLALPQSDVCLALQSADAPCEVTAKYSFLTPVQTVMGLARQRRDTRQSSAPAIPSSSNVTPFRLLCLFASRPADAWRSTLTPCQTLAVRAVEVRKLLVWLHLATSSVLYFLFFSGLAINRRAFSLFLPVMGTAHRAKKAEGNSWGSPLRHRGRLDSVFFSQLRTELE